MCLAGVLSGFAEAATTSLPKLVGLRVGESTVERATEAAGHDIGRRLALGEVFGPSRDWAWHKDAQGKTCAYVALDATGVGQQGPHGPRPRAGWSRWRWSITPSLKRRAAGRGPIARRLDSTSARCSGAVIGSGTRTGTPHRTDREYLQI